MSTQPDNERSAELMRLTLPLMAKHQVPVQPRNYAVWYSYVLGENPDLVEAIDKLVAARQRFTDEVNEQLYLRFASECDAARVEELRRELRDMLSGLAENLNLSGDAAARFEHNLRDYRNQLDDGRDVQSVLHVIESLRSETAHFQASGSSLKAHLSDSAREVERLREELELARHAALTDPLTGLANRQAFTDALDAAIAAFSPDDPLSLLMVDIDHFKRFNDNYGHLVGDRILCHVSRAMEEGVKGRDLVSRFGGEEFAVLLPHTPQAGAVQVAEQIRHHVQRTRLVRTATREAVAPITVSVGVACYHSGESADSFIERADQALYQSKRSGRNKVRVYGG